MSLQVKFRQFEEVIKLKNVSENAELREKRDRILNRLRAQTPRDVTFETFNQGSYAVGTGIKPTDGDYDIDVGIVINGIRHRDHDPVTVKSWIYEAAKDHTQKVEWRRPCITVYYQAKGEVKYHVDLAIFVADGSDTNARHYLAIGKQHSGHDQREWQPDGRRAFMDHIKKRCSGDDGAQFRRIVRYLKRWKDDSFPSHGNAAPSGHALTVAADRWFQVQKSGGLLSKVNYDDLRALKVLVKSMLDAFDRKRLSLKFRYEPRDDVFERMTDQQMKEFRERLDTLAVLLEEARRTDSSAPLRKAFGNDFPE